MATYARCDECGKYALNHIDHLHTLIDQNVPIWRERTRTVCNKCLKNYT